MVVACADATGGARSSNTATITPVTFMEPESVRSPVLPQRLYAKIRVALEKKATLIGAHDLLIAAHARASTRSA